MRLVTFLQGGVAMGCLVASAFFLRFWQRSSDRLFLRFCQAFLLLAISYVLIGTAVFSSDWQPYVYSVRLAAYALIAFAIVDKNRR